MIYCKWILFWFDKVQGHIFGDVWRGVELLNICPELPPEVARKVRNGSTLMQTKCLNTKTSGFFCLP